MVSALLAKGARLDLLRHDGRSVLWAAAFGNRVECVELLLVQARATFPFSYLGARFRELIGNRLWF